MIYGYCRISTKKQNIERQIRNIQKAYPTADIRQEVFTGTKSEGRKVFEQLLKIVRSGDTLVFDSVSRMSRNAEIGFEVYQELYDKGVELRHENRYYPESYQRVPYGACQRTDTACL